MEITTSLFLSILMVCSQAFADDQVGRQEEVTSQNSATPHDGIFEFQVQNRKQRNSTYWFPLLGLAVPGLPQFLNHQIGAGFVYSGAAAAGLGIAFTNVTYHSHANDGDLTKLTDPEKAVTFGLQTYQTAGSLSTYHAFRSTVQSRRKKGDFDFLTSDEETAGDLMLAPFHVSYLIEPTVIIPLGLFAGALIIAHNSGPQGSRNLTLSDSAFTLGISYNAGVGEEALFRGYLMMNLRQSWGSDFWSLAATSTLFSAAHISASNPFPWPQLAAGFYLGWLTEHNNWSLSKSVFTHAWWDLIAIGAELGTTDVAHRALFLPILDMTY